jgi:pSer/pThr/pTyr-binding forkhead associated (FHA) protein
LNTSAVSRYHAQLDAAEGGVYLVDLGTVNGTFVNDVQVDPNGRVALNDGDVITLGDVALRFMAPEARSGTKRAMVSLTPEARTIDAPGVPFRMVLDEPQQSVAPGARLQLTLGVENLSEQQIALNIEVGGLEPDWLKVNRREASLEPGEQVQAMISVRPPRSSHTRPGVYALTIRAVDAENPANVLEAVREIDVVPYAGIGIALQRSRSGEQFYIAVQNQGNVTTNVALEGYQRQRLLRYRFQPRQLALQPGETKQVTLVVQPSAGDLSDHLRT